jgi:hypothetical protein
MEAHEYSNGPEISPEQKTTSELVKLIRKLRWIGMDDEAEHVKVKLAMYRSSCADSVVAAPHDTD